MPLRNYTAPSSAVPSTGKALLSAPHKKNAHIQTLKKPKVRLQNTIQCYLSIRGIRKERTIQIQKNAFTALINFNMHLNSIPKQDCCQKLGPMNRIHLQSKEETKIKT